MIDIYFCKMVSSKISRTKVLLGGENYSTHILDVMFIHYVFMTYIVMLWNMSKCGNVYVNREGPNYKISLGLDCHNWKVMGHGVISPFHLDIIMMIFRYLLRVLLLLFIISDKYVFNIVIGH